MRTLLLCQLGKLISPPGPFQCQHMPLRRFHVDLAVPSVTGVIKIIYNVYNYTKSIVIFTTLPGSLAPASR